MGGELQKTKVLSEMGIAASQWDVAWIKTLQFSTSVSPSNS